MWIDFLPASTDQSKSVWLKGISFWKQFHFYMETVPNNAGNVSVKGRKGRFPKIIRAEVKGMLRSQHRPKTYFGTWYIVNPETPCWWAGWQSQSRFRDRRRGSKKSSGLGSVTSCVDFRRSLSIADYPTSLNLKIYFSLSSVIWLIWLSQILFYLSTSWKPSSIQKPIRITLKEKKKLINIWISYYRREFSKWSLYKI